MLLNKVTPKCHLSIYICTFLSKCKTMHIYMYLVAFKVEGFDIIVVASFNIPI